MPTIAVLFIVAYVAVVYAVYLQLRSFATRHTRRPPSDR